MGVVVQEMVRAEIAGVLFTNDPMTGNYNRMVLDASYGLGEVTLCVALCLCLFAWVRLSLVLHGQCSAKDSKMRGHLSHHL